MLADPYCWLFVFFNLQFYDLIFSDTNKYPQNRWEFLKSIEIIKNSKITNPKIIGFPPFAAPPGINLFILS